MSLRYASRIVLQSGARALQGIREHASKSLKDTAASAASSSSSSSSATAAANSNRVSRLLAARPSNLKSAAAAGEKMRAEEDLRTVMFLSCWGPN